MAKAAGQPLPQFSPDDVVNFMVTEAVVAAVDEDARKQEKARKAEEWRKAPVGSGGAD